MKKPIIVMMAATLLLSATLRTQAKTLKGWVVSWAQPLAA